MKNGHFSHTLMRKRARVARERQKEAEEVEKKRQEKDKYKGVKKEPRFDIFHINVLFQDESLSQFQFTVSDLFLIIMSTLLSLYTHFNEFGQPNTVVFDEVYFGNFTNYYRNGSYFFDIHPPLGKQLLYLGSKISGYRGDLFFGHIGQDFPNDHIKLLRFWPSLIGSLITPVMYMILRVNDVSLAWSTVVSCMVALDNAMLVESRFVLIDAYLWFFAALSILFCSLAIRFPSKGLIFSICTGFAAGATVSVKFTGAGVPIGVVVGFFMHFPLVKAFLYSFIAGLCGIFVFLLSFITHFLMFNKAGRGCAFHHPVFCKKLVEGKLNVFKETFSLIKTMLNSNFAINQPHPYSSKWWTWPLQLGLGNWMWVVGDKQLWCVGNPVVWQFAFFGLLFYVCIFPFYKSVKRGLWIFLTYILSYLPFALIKRAMWNYHYIIPLELSLAAAAIACSCIKHKLVSFFLPMFLLVLSILGHIYWSPITYGHPITSERFLQIMFKRWHY